MHQKWGKTKLIGSHIITMDFDNKSFLEIYDGAWKKTFRQTSVFYKIIFDSVTSALLMETVSFWFNYLCLNQRYFTVVKLIVFVLRIFFFSVVHVPSRLSSNCPFCSDGRR